jgi:hypothetical protein
MSTLSGSFPATLRIPHRPQPSCLTRIAAFDKSSGASSSAAVRPELGHDLTVLGITGR